MNLYHSGPRAKAARNTAFISDPEGNVIELMQIRPESAIYRKQTEVS